MAIITKQVTANATTATYLSTVPNGPFNAVISNTGNAAVLIGAGASVTQTNGVSIAPNGNISFQGYAASKGTDLYALVATGGANQTVSILISTTD